MVKAGSSDTRDRLMAAALELVAERGFDGVSVGDIEVAAGLARRSGALYKYFDSKLSVLRAGLEQHLKSVAGVELELSDFEPDEPLAELGVVARWMLGELDRERTITAVIEREGERFPELRDRMREGISERGYRVAAMLTQRWAVDTVATSMDHEALAVLIVGGLINVRRSAWTFGAPPLGIDDDRFLETFAMLCETLLRPEETSN